MTSLLLALIGILAVAVILAAMTMIGRAIGPPIPRLKVFPPLGHMVAVVTYPRSWQSNAKRMRELAVAYENSAHVLIPDSNDSVTITYEQRWSDPSCDCSVCRVDCPRAISFFSDQLVCTENRGVVRASMLQTGDIPVVTPDMIRV